MEMESAMRTLVAAFVGLIAGASGVSLAGAQVASEATLCKPESNSYDAVTAAPYSHHVMFEDEHVRVLEILLPPLAVEPVHIHALPSVIMGDTGGGQGAKFLYTEYRMEDGRFLEVSKKKVEPVPGYRTVYSTPEGPHSIANIGQVGVRYTRIEIKPERCAK